MNKVPALASAGIAGLLLSLLAACGGGGKGGGTTSTTGSTTSTGQGGGTTGDAGMVTTAQRAAAATTAATTSPACTGLPTAFYWEIGDAAGTLASGYGGAADAGAVDPSVSISIASSSKWLFGAYALEKLSLDAIVAAGNDVYLNFTSGYDHLDDALCALSPTVEACSTAGSNDQQSAGDVGKFYYNGGHLQTYAAGVAGLGGDYRSSSTMTPKLAADVQAAIGDIGLTYTTPLLSGGGAVAPSGYATFLRRILGGQLAILGHLGDRAVCAWTHHPDCDAIYSPVNETGPGSLTNDVSDEEWHYSLAHWVEEDGTFSSPGAYGFYPWIDASKTYYGIVARDDESTLDDVNGTKVPPYFASVACGSAIRAAWLAGHP